MENSGMTPNTFAEPSDRSERKHQSAFVMNMIALHNELANITMMPGQICWEICDIQSDETRCIRNELAHNYGNSKYALDWTMVLVHYRHFYPAVEKKLAAGIELLTKWKPGTGDELSESLPVDCPPSPDPDW
jgi:hypothetical protein